jgi:peptidyl-prolyl cis-trans isomerase SurA
VDEVVAIVNNSVITRRELLDRADEIESQLRAAKREVPPRPDLLGEVLERLVMERVQTQAAQDAGIKVTDQEVDRAIESVAQQNKMSATDCAAAWKPAACRGPSTATNCASRSR